MEFDGFYYDNKWWTGTTSLSREFNFADPVNIFAWGALTAVEVTGGAGLAYVGIGEATFIDTSTNRPVNTSTMIAGSPFPSPNYTNRVTSVTWLYGSTTQEPSWTPVNGISYANASLNMLIWS
jgi:hypothetical protein